MHAAAPRTLVVLFSCLAVASPALGQTKKPLEEKTIDLRSAILNDRLPFDVPFIMTGAIDKSVTEVQAWLAEAPAGDRNDPVPRCPAPENPVWRALQPWRAVVDLPVPPTTPEGNPSFKILFPRLRANRFYCVRFELGPPTPMTEAQVDAFLKLAFPLIDLPLREYGENDVIPVTTTDALRRTLMSAIGSVSGVKTPRPIPGSVFDPRLTDAEAHDRLVELVHPVLVGHSRRRDALHNIAVREEQIREEAATLERLVGDVAKIRDSRRVPAGSEGSDLSAWMEKSLPLLRQADAELRALQDTWDAASAQKAADAFAVARGRLEEGRPILAEAQKELAGATAPAADADVLKKLDGVRQALLGHIDETRVSLFDAANPQRGLHGAMLQRRDAIQGILAEFERVLRTEVQLITTSIGTFDTRHGWYVSGDVGLAYGWDVEQAFAYVGTNIYFRPVNKDAPLQSFGNFAQSFTRRFSAMIGITYAGKAEEAGRREPLIGGRLLVIGAGLRITDSIRVAGGGLVFKAVDPNPLATRRRVETSPFVSISFDVDVVGTLGELGGAFGVPNTSRRD